MSQTWIGLLVGARESSGALVDHSGTVLARISVPAATGPEEALDGLQAMVRRLSSKAAKSGSDVGAVGVGFPGVVDPQDGDVHATRNALRAWIGVDPAARLRERVGLPVSVRNDVACVLLGELVAGAVRGERNVLVAYSSTGVGGAILLDGRLVVGRHGLAGHLGHVPVPGAQGLPCTCGGTGHVDSVASAAAMTRLYAERRALAPGDVPYLLAVSQARLSGDDVARQTLEQGGTALGAALGGASNLLEPEVLLLAGEAMADPIYRAALEREVADQLVAGGAAPDIRLAELAGDAQLIGAAMGARAFADADYSVAGL